MPAETTTNTPSLEARLREFLDTVLRESGLRLAYQVRSAPAEADVQGLIVDFEGPDAGQLLGEDGELLRGLEHLAFEILQLGSEEHERVLFDCQHRRMLRMSELRMAATMAAERVQKTGLPYEFGPMSSRERRIVHLALRGVAGVISESEGVGSQRHIVLRSSAPQRPKARR